MPRPKPLLLIILDGFGVSLKPEGNPVFQAHTPTFDELDRFFPFTALQASGPAIGLPWGKAGNSEVGHLTIGAGRALYHHLPRIEYSIYDKTFFTNPAFVRAAEHVRAHSSRLHIAGLISSGTVHSYIDHLYALLQFAEKEHIPETIVHVFTDGKDAPPKEGAKFLDQLEERMKKEWPHARIGSVMGRFFAMDRDEQWDRIEEAYRLLTEGKGARSGSARAHLLGSYKAGTTDEFIKPCAIMPEGAGAPDPFIKKADALVFLNFREDSVREITHAFADSAFDKFPREKISDLFIATMTEYQKGLPVEVAFSPLEIHYPLSRTVGEGGLTHLHVAETEKYAHVTYFFNGGTEAPFINEKRILIPSASTAHFDEAPAMRAPEIVKTIIENIDSFDVIIANFANADMIGHTGNFNACVAAVEEIDKALGEIIPAIMEREGAAIITADHGNIELKRNIHTGEKLTQHSLNPVPMYLVGNRFRRQAARTEEEAKAVKKEVGGILSDIAPTMIELLELKKPDEMTGNSLVEMLSKQK